MSLSVVYFSIIISMQIKRNRMLAEPFGLKTATETPIHKLSYNVRKLCPRLSYEYMDVASVYSIPRVLGTSDFWLCHPNACFESFVCEFFTAFMWNRLEADPLRFCRSMLTFIPNAVNFVLLTNVLFFRYVLQTLF